MRKITEPNYAELEKFISVDRLSSYKTIVKKKSPKNLIAAYHWNKHVSSALYPILQCLEVTLRNSVHIAGSSLFQASDWYEQALKHGGDRKFKSDYAKWSQNFYRKSAGYPKQQSKKAWVSNHENMLKTAKKHLVRENKPTTASNVVASVMFGFWVSFFEDAYSGTDPKKFLWPHLETLIFQKGEAVKNRKQAHALLEELQQLRNRMSHHEPVWKNKSVVDDVTAINFLNIQVDQALKLIKSISSERYEHLLKTGKVSYFRGICSERTLRCYLKGDAFRKLDKRKVKRIVCREISKQRSSATILDIQNKPKFIVDLWPG